MTNPPKPARKLPPKILQCAELLPGLEMAARIALQTWNDFRTVFNLYPMRIETDPQPNRRREPIVEIARRASAQKPNPQKRKKKKPAAQRDRGKRKTPAEQREHREKLKAIVPAIKG
jgi:hypothetical protein